MKPNSKVVLAGHEKYQEVIEPVACPPKLDNPKHLSRRGKRRSLVSIKSDAPKKKPRLATKVLCTVCKIKFDRADVKSIDGDRDSDLWICTACASLANDEACCSVCNSPRIVKGNDILFCDGCDLGFHQRCLSPALTTIPEDDWFCSQCIKRLNKSKGATKKENPGKKQAENSAHTTTQEDPTKDSHSSYIDSFISQFSTGRESDTASTSSKKSTIPSSSHSTASYRSVSSSQSNSSTAPSMVRSVGPTLF